MNPILSIIIPAYNEERRIEKTLRVISDCLRKHSVSFEIIVVANNCTDNTVATVEGFKHSWLPELLVFETPHKLPVGNMKGYAISLGMKKALGKYHMFMDADNATAFENAFDFMKDIEGGVDIVIASRYVKNAVVSKKQPFYRVLISRLGNLTSRVLLLPGIYDTQCGFKMFTADASLAIFTRTVIDGWGTDLEILAIARSLGFKIKEAPVHWEAQDESTVKSHAFIHTLVELFQIRKNIRQGLYRK